MSKCISATDAKNNFGGLLEDVAALGRVDIVKHGRLVAVVLSPRAFESAAAHERKAESWGKTHMIPPEHARAARMREAPSHRKRGR
jgi:prevent-host-death family protein